MRDRAALGLNTAAKAQSMDVLHHARQAPAAFLGSSRIGRRRVVIVDTDGETSARTTASAGFTTIGWQRHEVAQGERRYVVDIASGYRHDHGRSRGDVLLRDRVRLTT